MKTSANNVHAPAVGVLPSGGRQARVVARPVRVTLSNAVVRIVAMSAVMGLCSVSLTGCGGSGETADDGVAERLAVDDLRSLVTMSPEPTGWPWPANPSDAVGSPPFELDKSDRSYPIQKALSPIAYQDAGIVSPQQAVGSTAPRRPPRSPISSPPSAAAGPRWQLSSSSPAPGSPSSNTNRSTTSERTASASSAGPCAAGQTTKASSRSAGREQTSRLPSTSPVIHATPTSRTPPDAGPRRSTTRRAPRRTDQAAVHRGNAATLSCDLVRLTHERAALEESQQSSSRSALSPPRRPRRPRAGARRRCPTGSARSVGACRRCGRASARATCSPGLSFPRSTAGRSAVRGSSCGSRTRRAATRGR